MSIFITIVLFLSTTPTLLFSALSSLGLYNETQDSGGISLQAVIWTLISFVFLGLQITTIVLWFIHYF